jgi:hypothetical protein
VGEIWNGPHPEDGQELEVRDEIPEGAPWPELDDEPQLSSPGVDPDMIEFFSKQLGGERSRGVMGAKMQETQPRSKRRFEATGRREPRKR